MASSFAPSSIAKITRSSISSPLSSGASKISGITPKLFVSGMRFRPRTMSSPILSPQSSVTDTLVETNKILVEIQQQIAIAFGMRNAEEKEKKENLKEERSRRRLRLREGALESVKKIGGAIKKTAKFVASPFKGFFDKILEFISLLGLGIGANAIFKWFEKKENREKLKKFFKIIVSNWKLIRNILGVIGGAILLGKIMGIVGAITGAVKFFGGLLLNPMFVAGIGVIMAAAMQGLGPQEKALIKELEDMGGLTDENREKLIQKYEDYRKDYKKNPFKYPLITARNLTGEVDREVEERIRFIKTGEFDYGGKKMTFDFGFGDFITNTQGGKFNFDTGKEESTSPGGEKPGFTFGGGRALGGPVMSGNAYLVGEKGPELFAPNIDGSIINNMRTEKIYEMISSKNAGKINFVSMELPPKFMNSEKNASTEEQQEIPIPTISAVNGSNPYMSITPNVYGIYV